jgi:hypothetical protein
VRRDRRLLFVSVGSSALAEIGDCVKPIDLGFFITPVCHVARQDPLDLVVVITPHIAAGLRGRAESCCRDDAWGTNREWPPIFQTL